MAGGDNINGTALRFLVKQVLERRKEEEEEKAARSSASSPKRKRTKRRKRLTPQTSSRPSRCAALVVDNGSRIFVAGYAGYDAFHAVFFRAGQSCLASWTVWTRM